VGEFLPEAKLALHPITERCGSVGLDREAVLNAAPQQSFSIHPEISQ
jgi:hypothetical protein